MKYAVRAEEAVRIDLLNALAANIYDVQGLKDAKPTIYLQFDGFDRQTHESLRKYVVEETYEVVDAIDSGDRDRLAGELGDAALSNLAAANIGKDVTAGEDPEIRQAVLAAMSGRSATVVVMDPNTGRIFTIVNQKMALGSPVKPCSTVKMIVGLAALRENVFDPTEELVRSRKYGPLNLTEALAHSDNPFFQMIGKMTGYENVIKYADNFGFGQKTGVNYVLCK